VAGSTHSVRTRAGSSLLGLPGLVFIYLLLGILGTVFASAQFAGAMGGQRPSLLLAVFLGIPVVLAAFLVAVTVRLLRDLAAGQPGSRLRGRLLVYFLLTVLFSFAPSTALSASLVVRMSQSWFAAELPAAVADARWFAVDAYQYRLAVFERALSSGDLDRVWSLADAGDIAAATAALRAEDKGFLAAQTFVKRGDAWMELHFLGDRTYARAIAPPLAPGFLARDPIAHPDMVQYVLVAGSRTIRLVSFSLGGGFDARVARIESSMDRTAAIAALQPELGKTVALLFAGFLLPTLLMALLIAFSFSAKVIQPIVGLAEATKRVAEGDFSIRIMARPDDELGALVKAFNAMVRELERTRASSLQEQKVNVWQDMAQRLAHEIKNPLTPIKLSAERVLRRWKTDPDRVGEILESSMLAVVQEVDGLTTMLQEFRTFARLPPPTLSSAVVRELVEEAAAVYRSSYPKVAFEYESIDPELSVNVDRRHIAQVLANLILNAVDAMEGRGKLEFRTDLVKKRDCRYCRLSVRDDGKGIPENIRSQIFTPYFTTKDAGTGLGLSIVERIVTDHGGKVWFDSAEGIGTTFYLDLPIDRPKAT
jgi:nitrogen fixation/metabolism regulation signal transduction histidine kinase